VFGVALSRQRGSRREVHETQTVERGAAESVRADIEMGAGELKISGGANKLLEATFDYTEAEGKPTVAYDVAGKDGHLTIQQPSSGIHFGRTHNTWDLRLNNDVPTELKIEMGAGQGDLRLRGLTLTKLDLQMGAGQVTLDLTGDWKRDLEAKIEGGVGTATIRLPRNVGVRVRAQGGIGSIHARGMQREGEFYVNEAYGKSKVTLNVDVQGGIGQINLEPEL
jgi:hypothetical protein